MAKVFVTGATGFVGAALARALVAEGHQVTALARENSSRERLAGVPIKWVTGDVTDRDSLRGKLDGADWLIHAAGMLGEAGIPEQTYLSLHEGGTINVLAEAEQVDVQRILYVSSPGVLGPIVGDPADETAPLAPSNPYERSKAAAENAALVFVRGGLPVVIARPEFIYGPGDVHVAGLFQAVGNGRYFYIGGGNNTCHPTYIADAVQGMILALKNGRVGETYHITGPKPVTFRELAETIADELGVNPPKLSVPKPIAWIGALGLELLSKIIKKRPPLSRTGVAFFSEDRRFSWQKAHDELGYSPEYDLKHGIAETVAYYKKHGVI